MFPVPVAHGIFLLAHHYTKALGLLQAQNVTGDG
jgi:hypothetical protein